jgi:hypothetical protein
MINAVLASIAAGVMVLAAIALICVITVSLLVILGRR